MGDRVTVTKWYRCGNKIKHFEPQRLINFTLKYLSDWMSDLFIHYNVLQFELIFLSALSFIFLSKSIYIFIHALFNIWQIGRAAIKLRNMKIHAYYSMLLLVHFCKFQFPILLDASMYLLCSKSRMLTWELGFNSNKNCVFD